jgi:hypothetical protein
MKQGMIVACNRLFLNEVMVVLEQPEGELENTKEKGHWG